MIKNPCYVSIPQTNNYEEVYIPGDYAILAFTANPQSCLPEGITFTTQEQIDNFQADYPGCTEIEGSVSIIFSVISNLDGLNTLTTIGGSLYLDYNDSLTTLNGLENLSSIGEGLWIGYNNSLTTLSGLRNLDSVGGAFSIHENDALTTLSGLENLTFIGELFEIFRNDALTTLSELDNLSFIGGGSDYNGKSVIKSL